jgi:tRNA(Leu) C34 or U34 (ribose-2'-O)-methylase TrmL
MSRHVKRTKDFGPRGYFGIGIHEPENKANVGGLWRSAMLLGASFVFTIGNTFGRINTDTQKSHRHLPLFYFDDFDQFMESRPHDAKLVAVEQHEKSYDIAHYAHPERAIYLMGTEEQGLPDSILEQVYQIVEIPSLYDLSLNVHVAGSIVMYDRMAKTRFKTVPNPTL